MRPNIVVFGAAGFVGHAIAQALKTDKQNVLELGRNEVDLLDKSSCEKIQHLVNDGDIVVLAFARAPARNLEDIFENLTMINNVLDTLRISDLSYVLNVSSDAVYSDLKESINEKSSMAPTSAHGIMHCMRERLVDQTFGNIAGHLRPTLIFGKDDPHNGYGPNSFLRKISAGEDIILFGKGEEMRDHIHINDVAAVATAMINNHHLGGLNAVTGEVRSFHDIANSMVGVSNAKCKVLTSQRDGPMPHNGYRAFDNSALLRLLPDIKFSTVEDYLIGKNK